MYPLPSAVGSFGGDKNRTKIIHRTENVCNLDVGNDGVRNLLYN
jgi:hypothetical protein